MVGNNSDNNKVEIYIAIIIDL